MAQPNIKAIRVDERLIHGQGRLWISSLGVNLVIVANDEVSKSSIQQTLMKSLLPKSIGIRFFTLEETCEKIHKASPKQTIFIVVKSPKDALTLAKGGVPFKDLNVGNIHLSDGKTQLTNYISVGEEDIESLKELKNEFGIVFNTRTTPLGGDAGVEFDMNKYIENK